MPVHPVIQKVLNSLPQKEHGPLIPEEHRKLFNQPVLPLEKRIQVHHVEDRIVSLTNAEIPIRIYTPEDKEYYPILLYFHGGAFFSGNLESHDEIVRPICMESGYKTIAVDYRLAPEHPYPAAVEDAYAITEWVSQNGAELQWDGKNLALAGDSCGGSLVATTIYKARERKSFNITNQVYFYPALDLDFSQDIYPSRTTNGTGYFVEKEGIPVHNSFYLSTVTDATDPYVSPIKQDDLAGLPDALIITAEYDPFRDEGELFAKKLDKAKVNVEFKRYDGATHGFLGKFTHLKEFSDVYERVGIFLKKHKKI